MQKKYDNFWNNKKEMKIHEENTKLLKKFKYV